MSITTPSVKRGRDDSLAQNQIGSVPTVSGLRLVSEAGGDGPVRETVLYLSAVALTLTDQGSVGSGGLKLYDFPAGVIQVLGVTGDLTIAYGTVTDANLLGAIGTAAPNTDGDLGDSNEANFQASTATATVSGVGSFKPKPTDSVYIDGTSTAVDLYLNAATSSDPGTNNTVTYTGYLKIVWINHGDN